MVNENEVSEPLPIERTMKVLNLTEGLRVTEAVIRLSSDNDCNEK